MQRIIRISRHSSRHSRFNTQIRVARTIDHSCKLVSNLKDLDRIDSTINQYYYQRNRPKPTKVYSFIIDFLHNVFNVLVQSISDNLTLQTNINTNDLVIYVTNPNYYKDFTQFAFIFHFSLKANRLIKSQEILIDYVINGL